MRHPGFRHRTLQSHGVRGSVGPAHTPDSEYVDMRQSDFFGDHACQHPAGHHEDVHCSHLTSGSSTRHLQTGSNRPSGPCANIGLDFERHDMPWGSMRTRKQQSTTKSQNRRRETFRQSCRKPPRERQAQGNSKALQALSRNRIQDTDKLPISSAYSSKRLSTGPRSLEQKPTPSSFRSETATPADKLRSDPSTS